MFILAKLVLGIGLLVLLGYMVDWNAVAAVLGSASPGWITGAFAVSVLGVLISAEKWNGLLRDSRVRLPFFAAARLYWVGMFFSNFLPTSVGGDALRLALTPSHGRTERVAATILVERLTGFFVMLVLCAVGLLTGPLSFGHPHLAEAMLLAVLGLLIAVAAAVLAPTVLAKLLPMVIERLPRLLQRIVLKMQRIAVTIARQSRRGTALLRALVLSVPFYGTIFIAQYCVLRAVGAQLPLLDVVLVGALVPLLGLVPISLNGLGVTEGVFVAVYGAVGVVPKLALAAALLRRSVDLLNSALGGLFWLIDRRHGIAATAAAREAVRIARPLAARPSAEPVELKAPAG